MKLKEVILLFEENGRTDYLELPHPGDPKAYAKTYMPEFSNVDRWQLFEMGTKKPLAEGTLIKVLREARNRGWF